MSLNHPDPDMPAGQQPDPNVLKHVSAAFSPDSRFSMLIKQGQNQLRQGDSVSAEATIRNALELARNHYAPGHPYLTRAVENFAHCCNLNYKESLAETAYLELITLADTFPEAFSAQGISSAINLALLSISAEDLEMAEQWARNAVQRSELISDLSDWVAPCRLALGLVLKLRDATSESEKQIALAFEALKEMEGTPLASTVAKQLTRLSAVFANNLEFDKALACVRVIAELAPGDDMTSKQLRLAALGERVRIEDRRGQIRASYECEEQYIEMAGGIEIRKRSLFLNYLSLARKLIELGSFEEGEKKLRNLYEQGRLSDEPNYILQSIRVSIARSEYSRGALGEAHQTVERTIRDIFSSLPEDVRDLIQKRPDDIPTELPEVIMKSRSGHKTSDLPKELDPLIPLIGLRWHIEHYRDGGMATPEDLKVCHSLAWVLRKEEAPGTLEYYKMNFIDNLGTVARLESLEELLTQKQRLNSREELSLRVSAALECHVLGLTEPGEKHLNRATFLYNRLIASSDSLQSTETVTIFASALAEYGEYDKAEKALKRAYELLERSPLREGPEYLQLLDRMAINSEFLNAADVERYAEEARSMRQRLTKMNPGFSFDK